jgi:hypothetical protein
LKRRLKSIEGEYGAESPPIQVLTDQLKQAAAQDRQLAAPEGRRPVRLAVDRRTNSLLVRGPQQQLVVVKQMVSAMDVPPGQPVQGLVGDSSLRILPMRHRHAHEMARLIQTLEIPVTVLLPDGEARSSYGGEGFGEAVAGAGCGGGYGGGGGYPASAVDSRGNYWY